MSLTRISHRINRTALRGGWKSGNANQEIGVPGRPSGQSFPPEHRTLRALNAANVYVSFTSRFSGPVGICSRNARGGLYFYGRSFTPSLRPRASRVRALLGARHNLMRALLEARHNLMRALLEAARTGRGLT